MGLLTRKQIADILINAEKNASSDMSAFHASVAKASGKVELTGDEKQMVADLVNAARNAAIDSLASTK